jgi:hypothetical protein
MKAHGLFFHRGYRGKEKVMLKDHPRYRPGHSGYVSEFTQFIDQFIEQHPEVSENRRRGWYIFWDKRVDLDELERAKKDNVRQNPYYYE